MKLSIFILLMILGVNNPTPTQYGHRVVDYDCQCQNPFKDTATWTKGKRSGYYCIAISRKGNQYKRYFSQWIKLKQK